MGVKPSLSWGAGEGFLTLPPPTFSRNRTRALFDRDAYREMEAMVERARESVRLEFFLFGGPVAAALIDRLQAKQAQGVRVAMTLDRRMGILPRVRGECRDALQRLRAAGIDVLHSDRRALPDAPGRPAVDHNKFLVVDEREALVGGMNIGSLFFRHHDVMLHLEGPVAGVLARQFDHDRRFARDPRLPRPTGSPVLPLFSPCSNEPCHNAPYESQARILGTGIGRRTTRAAILQNLRGARDSVRIAMSEIGCTDVLEEVIAAQRRGVAISVLLDPQDLREYLSPWLGPLRERWPRGVLNAGAIRRLHEAGIDVRLFRVGEAFALLHMKLAIFDERSAIVGSTNWTRGGFEWVGETDVELHGGTAIEELGQQFARDWADSLPATPSSPFTEYLCHLYERLAQ